MEVEAPLSGGKEPTPRRECVDVENIISSRAGDQYKRLARLWPPFCDSPASIPHTPAQPNPAEPRRWFAAGSNPRSLLACPLPFPRLPRSLLVQGYSKLWTVRYFLVLNNFVVGKKVVCSRADERSHRAGSMIFFRIE